MSTVAPNPGPQRVRTKAENRKIVFEGALKKAIDASPELIKPYFLSVAPMLVTIFVVFDFFIPYVSYANNLAWKYGEKAYIALLPYEPEFLFPMVAGIFLMLFGGHFMMIVTCVEAYRICGWETTRDGLVQLYSDYIKLREANAKDDELDEDNDGIKDVLEISDKELVTRKFLLFLRSCDPQKLAFALTGIYSGFIAVMASVRIKMARTIALGVAIGDCTSSVLMKTFRPFLERIIPDEYEKWIPVVITYISKLFGIYIAATVERILTAFHSGIRGATLFVAAFTVYTKRRGRAELSQGYWDEAFAFLLAAFGIYAQISSGFRLPFPLNLLLLPVTIVEKIITLFVYYVPSDAHA